MASLGYSNNTFGFIRQLLHVSTALRPYDDLARTQKLVFSFTVLKNSLRKVGKKNIVERESQKTKDGRARAPSIAHNALLDVVAVIAHHFMHAIGQ